jgi:hypothetical protein
MNSNKKNARIAGLLFLFLVITGVFAELFVRGNFIVHGDPAATFNHIKASEWLFSLGIVSDLLMSTFFLFFAFILYLIFKPMNHNLARILLISTAISVVILCMNTLNLVAALLLTSGADYLSAFDQGQLNGLVTFFLNMHTNGYNVAQIFYGLYLFPLGYMIFKSALIPRIIGVLLMLGCIVDQLDVIRFFLFPHVESVILQNITLPAVIGEFSLCLWLLIMGAKEYYQAKPPIHLNSTVAG